MELGEASVLFGAPVIEAASAFVVRPVVKGLILCLRRLEAWRYRGIMVF